jgi:hypothetical protein
MGKIVTIPKDKRRKPLSSIRKGLDRSQWPKIKDRTDRLVLARELIDRFKVFIEDSTRNEMWTQHPKLSPEKIDERIKAGPWTYRHSTVIEPADLDLYRSYMYPPLSMPKKPEVMISFIERDERPGIFKYFMEGRVLVKAKRPDGIESWLVVSVPCPSFFMALEGVCWGWPKYVADEMTVTPTKAEVIYQGEVRMSMDFTPGGVDEATEKELKERGNFEAGNTVAFHVYRGGGCLVGKHPLSPKGDVGGIKVVEWQAGMHKVYLRPMDQDPCAGLIPANSVTPGVYQVIFSIGGGESGRLKIKA